MDKQEIDWDKPAITDVKMVHKGPWGPEGTLIPISISDHEKKSSIRRKVAAASGIPYEHVKLILVGIAQIGAEVKELAGRAREKKLMPDEYTGATFSVSNLGMFGVEEFTAIINPPEAGILAAGAVQQRPVVEDGALTVGTRMDVTLSVDHRSADGAIGAEFLAALKRLLESPLLLMLGNS